MKTKSSMKIFLIPAIFFAAFFVFGNEAKAAEYYVSPSGNDSNSGSIDTPFKTIQKAADIVNPGDTVIVKDGTYTDTDADDKLVKLYKSGTSINWITIKAENPCVGTTCYAILDGQSNTTAFAFFGQETGLSYIRIEGFEIKGFDSHAGMFNLHSEHHITFYNNYVHDIARRTNYSSYGDDAFFISWGTHDFTFDSNIIRSIGRLNAGTTPKAPDESAKPGCASAADPADNSCISPHSSDPAYVAFYGSCGNHCYNHDHAFYAGRYPGDGPAVYNTMFKNNVIWGTGSGYHIILSYSNNTQIINNTFIGDNSGRYGQVRIQQSATNVNIENNIFYNDGHCGIHMQDTYGVNSGTIRNNLSNLGITYQNSSLECNIPPSYVPGTGTWDRGDNIYSSDPLFVNPAGNDYHLQVGSPTINKGIPAGINYDADGNLRDSAPDIGAYEYVGTKVADTTPPAAPQGLSVQ